MSTNSNSRFSRFGTSLIHRASAVVVFFFAIASFTDFALAASHEDRAALEKRHNHANELYAQGKHEEAEVELRAVVAAARRVLGPEHRHTLIIRDNLGKALYAQGKYAVAEKEYRAVLAIRERAMGESHDDIYLSCDHLAACLAKQHKAPEALDFARRAYEGWHTMYGENHLYTKNARKLLEELEQSQKPR